MAGLDTNVPSWDTLQSELNDLSNVTEINTLDLCTLANPDDKFNMETNIKITDLRTEGCYSCGGRLFSKGSILTCQSCGLEIPGGLVASADEDHNIVAGLNTDCNVNNKGFVSIKIIGKGSYGMNRNMMKNCANYKTYRTMATLKEMHNWNSQSSGKQLPKNIIEETNRMFATIKDHGLVYRKNVKRGVQAACLYYICHINGISKTPTEIAQIASIDEKFLSMGDRILRDLNERRIITIPGRINSIPSYIDRYFELLGISPKYKQFVIDIIEQADADHLHVLHDSKNNTKCIGTIYLLIERVPYLRKKIDKEQVEKECSISKTTFVKYYTMLCKFYRRFAHCFAKHGIKMKREWKEKVDNLATDVKPRILHSKRKYMKRNLDAPDVKVSDLDMDDNKSIISEASEMSAKTIDTIDTDHHVETTIKFISKDLKQKDLKQKDLAGLKPTVDKSKNKVDPYQVLKTGINPTDEEPDLPARTISDKIKALRSFTFKRKPIKA